MKSFVSFGGFDSAPDHLENSSAKSPVPFSPDGGTMLLKLWTGCLFPNRFQIWSLPWFMKFMTARFFFFPGLLPLRPSLSHLLRNRSFMKTISKKRGRPRSAFHTDMTPVIQIAQVDGCAATKRNWAYQIKGQSVITKLHLHEKLLGWDGIECRRKGWQGFCAEVGRWETSGQIVSPALLLFADDDELALSEMARCLRRIRLGKPDPRNADIAAIFRRAVRQIRQRFTGVSDEALREGAHAALDELS
jgi:hypothetical protein